MSKFKKADPFYQTREWQRVRYAACQRARWTCEWCKRDCSGKHQARIDHRIPRKQNPALALHPANLRLLCVDCDAKRHADKGTRAVPFTHVGLDGYPL